MSNWLAGRICGFVGCLLVSGSAVALADDPIFPDKNLEAVVRKYVFEKSNNEEPVTEKYEEKK